MRACIFGKSILLMFLHFKNAKNIHYKKSLYSIVVKKNVHKMSIRNSLSRMTIKPLLEWLVKVASVNLVLENKYLEFPFIIQML